MADLRGAARDARPPPPLAQNFFIFMQFSGKIDQIIGWRTPLGLAPPPLGNPGFATAIDVTHVRLSNYHEHIISRYEITESRLMNHCTIQAIKHINFFLKKKHHGGKVKTYTYGGHGWYKEQTHGYHQGHGHEHGHKKGHHGGHKHGKHGHKESPYWSASEHFGGWKQSHGHN